MWACLVLQNEAPALERFFSCEGLARVMRAAKNEAAYRVASKQAREAFNGLDEADKGWCRGALDGLI